jgi:hypothetical protein
MWEDPIVAEVHQAREKLAAAYNFDVTAFFADLRRRQAALGERLIRPGEQAEPTAEAEQSRPADSGGSTSSGAAPAA